MRQAKAFFFVCLGVLCLVASYHFGASRATAQGSENPIVAIVPEGTGWVLAMAANGDMYRTTNSVGTRTYGWELVGNVPTGSGNPVGAMALEGTGWVLAIAANGDTYRSTNTVMSRNYVWELVGNVPTGSGNPMVAILPEEGTGRTGYVLAVAANGDTYRTTSATPGRSYNWELVGSMSGPTPAQSMSIGQLKAKYAPPAMGK